MGLLKCDKCGNIIFDMSNGGAVSCTDGGHYKTISIDSIIPEIMDTLKKVNDIFKNVNIILALEKDKFNITQNKIKKRIKKNKKGAK